MALDPILKGTTQVIDYLVRLDSITSDITADTVTLTIKAQFGDSDADALLTKDADVATSGANGIAIFTLTPADTDIEVGNYPYDVIWYRSTGEEYELETETVIIKKRVSDV